MKKISSLILILVTCLLLCACGKSEAVLNVEGLISAIGEVSLESKAAIGEAQSAFEALSADEKTAVENYFVLVESQNKFEQLMKDATKTNAKEAYDSIKIAWTVADLIGGDIYNVWHGWVYKKEDMSAKGLQFFVDETTLSEEEVLEGFAARNYANEQYAKTKVSWTEYDEEKKQFYRDSTEKVFEKASKSRQYVGMDDALGGIVNAFILKGEYRVAREQLETAKQVMKELPEDFEYYHELKGFFTTASALVDFCASPSGSLNQYITLLNDYRKEARDYMNDLDFVFE